MDLNDYWQENKRFVTTVGAGLLAFFIGLEIVDSVYGTDLRRAQARVVGTGSKLAEARYGSGDLSAARASNGALRAAVDTLAPAVDFEARERFRLDPARGSATSQYFETVSGVREELLVLARRRNLRVPEDLGLPALSPTREILIERYLEALDVVDRVVRMALDTGVARIEKVGITPDPSLESTRGVGAIERTKVSFRMHGAALALMRLVSLSQTADAERGTPLAVDAIDIKPEKQKPGEAWLEVTFLVARLHEDTAAEESL